MKLLISCPFWITSLLSSELKRLKFQPFKSFSTGTMIETDLKGLYTINLRSRLANKVYVQLASGKVSTFDELFTLIKNSSYGLRSSNTNITLKIKTIHSQLSAPRSIQSIAHKALLESIKHFGKAEETQNELFLLLEHNQANLYLNTSGSSLHQRGYRTQTWSAPLKENLAAAMLLFSGRKFKSGLRDPFCGSGTIPIEALLLAKNIAPGSKRHFAFEQFKNFDPHLRSMLKEQAQAQIYQGNYQIIASDLDPEMIRIAQQNAKNRDLDKDITFKIEDARKADFNFTENTRVVSNPPYGKRIWSSDLQTLYHKLESLWTEKSYGGIITSYPNFKLNSALFQQKKLFNGEEPCTFRYKKIS